MSAIANQLCFNSVTIEALNVLGARNQGYALRNVENELPPGLFTTLIFRRSAQT